jgi:hypothetical protein
MNAAHDKAKRMAAWYNILPNLLWSILSLLPLTIFCYRHLPLQLLILFLAISLPPAFLPSSMIDRLRIARKARTYRKLGVGLVQGLSQHGDIVNRLIRRTYPEYKAVRRDAKSVKGLITQTYAYEKFHLMLFLFFSLASMYALGRGLVSWAAALFVLNLLYNVYPILLQQYIRMKLAFYFQKNKEDQPSASSTKNRLKCLG